MPYSGSCLTARIEPSKKIVSTKRVERLLVGLTGLCTILAASYQRRRLRVQTVHYRVALQGRRPSSDRWYTSDTGSARGDGRLR